jgi:hypothetical protein
MTKQEYRQQDTHWLKQENYAARQRRKLKAEYISKHAPYPIGSKVRAENNNKEGVFIIASYDLDETLKLSAVFETLEGKAVFMSRPTILELLK